MTAMPTNSHKFANVPTAAKQTQAFVTAIFRVATYFILLCAVIVFGDVFLKGAPVIFQAAPPFINWEFLTQKPETLHVFDNGDGTHLKIGEADMRAAMAKGQIMPTQEETYVYSSGGIFPCIVGTVLLVIGSMTIALVLGVCSAVYLSEYSNQGKVINFVRLAILNLAGVPSIVFGLFGYGLFVLTFGWGVSLLAGWFTLAFMVLPVIITASEESLRAVPKGFREGSLALGATQWQTINNNVLPYALPGILTSCILGISRVAGETAPIMFTAAFAFRNELPWEGLKNFISFFKQGVMALPYHIYVVATKVPLNEYTQRVQYGTTFVFLLVVLAIALASILLRNKVRSKYRW